MAGLLNCSGIVIDAPEANPLVDAVIIGAPLYWPVALVRVTPEVSPFRATSIVPVRSGPLLVMVRLPMKSLDARL